MQRTPRLLLRIVPRKTVSRATGWFARLRLPGWMLRPVLRWFARRYGVDLEQAARPLEDYTSFGDFFTRTLRPGARPLPEDPGAVASPCDGTVSISGRVERGMLVQVKGHTYALADLLGDVEAARRLEGGTYQVIYLAPGDYHRFHWPFDGLVEKAVAIPGDLWSVDPRAVESVPNLFARNERAVCLGSLRRGGRFAYVPVGAVNVGSIRLVFSSLRTNPVRREDDADLPGPHWGTRGEAFGMFELGSTIVLVLSADAGVLDDLPAGTRLRMGQPIGRLGA